MAKTNAELKAEIAKLEEHIITLSKPVQSVSDSRLSGFWPMVHEYAEEAGLCSEYDDFLDRIGAPARPKNWQGSITVQAKVLGEAGLEELFIKIEKLINDTFDVEEVDFSTYDFEEVTW